MPHNLYALLWQQYSKYQMTFQMVESHGKEDIHYKSNFIALVLNLQMSQ